MSFIVFRTASSWQRCCSSGGQSSGLVHTKHTTRDLWSSPVMLLRYCLRSLAESCHAAPLLSAIAGRVLSG